ncbi:MAG: N-acetylmuramoyl-L-alanine amidase [Bradymonadales bacterium]|nr:N-acetylmuramoyl-L-alanine amidase [Bradymonadales bacterium]
MASFSNEIIVAGQSFPLGGDIQVVNFMDNMEYSYRNPQGSPCRAAEQAPAVPSIPGVTGLSVPREPSETEGAARGWTFRRGLRALEEMASVSAEEKLDRLARQLETIVIHHDASYHAHSCFCILAARGLSSHFIINHDGGVLQGLDPWYMGFHCRDFNATSIGFDMNNVATVEGHQSRYSDPLFGTVADYTVREVVEGRINRSIKRSFAYTEAQYVSLVAVMRILRDILKMPMIYPQSEAGGGVLTTRLANPAAFRGFWGHYHNTATKWDPGPGFDWDKVMEGLHGKSNFWPIDLGQTRLGDIRTDSQVAEASRIVYRNTEEQNEGGNYPVGLNQEWHNGVHIFCPAGTPVRAVADGKVLLVRNGPNLPLGSPNFVLIQHDMTRERIELLPDGASELVQENIRWYSLYMHLQRMNPDEVPPEVSQDEEQTQPDRSTGRRSARAEQEAPPPAEQGEQREIPEWYKRLVWLARRMKRGNLQPGRDYDEQDVRIAPEQFHSLAFGLLRLPDAQHAFESIEDGNPYRFVVNPDTDEGIPVRGGELIGYTGEYGELLGEQVSKRPMLHFEIFSTVPIFDDTRFDVETWTRVQADLSGNSLVKSRDIIEMIRGGTGSEMQERLRSLELGKGRMMTPSEIDNFFRSGPEVLRQRMRTLIASHTSEWDVALDDSITAGVNILWPWQTNWEYLFWRAHHIGFKWMTDETRDLLGLIEDPKVVYTYHPIYLLGWWAVNFGRSIHGQSFAGLEGEELVEAVREGIAAGPDEEDLARGAAVQISLEEMDDFRIQYDDFLGVDNGEWTAEVNIVSPFDARR